MSHFDGVVDTAKLNALRESDPFAAAVFDQLDRILANPRFQRAQENSRTFLRYIVVMRVLGLADAIKESTIAHDVFKAAAHHTADSGQIREAARVLRQRLAEFYQNEGAADQILITIPLGSYIPAIRDRRSAILVSTFVNWNFSGDQNYLCDAVTNEVVYQLRRNPNLFAQKVTSFADDADHQYWGVRGSLVCHGMDTITLCFCVGDFGHRRTACKTVEGTRDALFRLGAEIADFVTAVVTSASQVPAKPTGSSTSCRPDEERHVVE